ncbi:MAG: M20 family peptidase [Gemmatimonadetes bacterium]|nr:M20 family peptidase [Gemmatimonadota bacterium]
MSGRDGRESEEGTDAGGSPSTSAASGRLDGAKGLMPSVTEILGRLVGVESPSRDEAGLLAATSVLADEAGRRGGRVSRIPAPGYGQHLLADFGAVDFGSPEDGELAAHPLLVVGHLDTVHPRGTLDRCPFRREDDRLCGPGIYDMKGSWAAAVGALDLLAIEGRSPRPMRWFVSCDEEVGALHSRPHLEAEGRQARGALVLEPPLPGGAMKVRRKGVARYALHVKGRAAHAGVDPERGANAIHELTRVVVRALEAANSLEGTTVSVGLIRGGSAVNVVAGDAWAELDVRFWTEDDGRRVDRWIREIRSEDGRCEIEVEGGVDRGALEPNERNAGLVAAIREEAAALGRSLGAGATGGASDAQILSGVGCPVADGLGIEGGGAHTLEEHLLIADLPFRIALYAALFSTL